jgi:hypothetical protein
LPFWCRNAQHNYTQHKVTQNNFEHDEAQHKDTQNNSHHDETQHDETQHDETQHIAPNLVFFTIPAPRLQNLADQVDFCFLSNLSLLIGTLFWYLYFGQVFHCLLTIAKMNHIINKTNKNNFKKSQYFKNKNNSRLRRAQRRRSLSVADGRAFKESIQTESRQTHAALRNCFHEGGTRLYFYLFCF